MTDMTDMTDKIHTDDKGTVTVTYDAPVSLTEAIERDPSSVIRHLTILLGGGG